MMFKNILMLVLLSVAAIMFQNQLLGVLHVVTKLHDQIAKGLGLIFSVSSAGEMVQSVLALLFDLLLFDQLVFDHLLYVQLALLGWV